MKQQLSILFVLISCTLWAQIPEKQLDDLVEKTMKTFDVPGIAVAIVKDGKVVVAKGYGVRSIITKEKTDAYTLFGIASNSKAFTTAALSILIDEKKLDWNDKVVKYIPEFKMYNDYVTNEFTIKDLLTHRSGLGLGAGDLMIWPDKADFNANDIIHNLQYLKPVSAFRTKYDYDNLLYIVAGEVIHRITGQEWAEFIEQRIMQPLGMDKSAGTWVRLKDTSDVIAPHVPIDGKLKVISRYKNRILDAAGGIYSNVNDMSKWAIMQLNKGKYESGTGQNQLFSEERQTEMWTPQTIIPAYTVAPYNTHFSAYGLGWGLADVKGYKQISHTGGLEGTVTQVTLIPELQLGIIVLTNQQSGAAFRAITNTIKNSYMDIPAEDLVTLYSNGVNTNAAEDNKVTNAVWEIVASNQKAKIKIDTQKYTGTFHDNWFGDIVISEKKGKMYFASKRSPQLKGEVFFYKENNFVVKWDNPYFHADAHIFYENDNTTIKMLPIAPDTDFSYDFQDLEFIKVN
ncbi:MAG: serine hydrolase [Flavobacterium sp.]|nr:serine hydrolase [Flavobacterium sp.]